VTASVDPSSAVESTLGGYIATETWYAQRTGRQTFASSIDCIVGDFQPNVSQNEASSAASFPTPNPNILTPYTSRETLPYLRAERRVIGVEIYTFRKATKTMRDVIHTNQRPGIVVMGRLVCPSEGMESGRKSKKAFNGRVGEPLILGPGWRCIR
jgi:hypothetical protein